MVRGRKKGTKFIGGYKKKDKPESEGKLEEKKVEAEITA